MELDEPQDHWSSGVFSGGHAVAELSLFSKDEA